MTKKIFAFTLTLLIALAFSSASFAAFGSVPPSKGQWALALESYSLLYTKADRGASNTEIEMPDKWISVPSAVRDDNNYLWYKVTVNGKSGWLPQNGIRLKMGGKSKSASNLFRNYTKARKNITGRSSRSWTQSTENGMTIYTSDNAEFWVREGKKGVEDVYFQTSDPDTCELFFGTDLIGMYMSKLRSKLGTPTMRESPYENINVSVLSYELSDRDMTLSVTLVRDENDEEGKVESIELYRGRTGSND